MKRKGNEMKRWRRQFCHVCRDYRRFVIGLWVDIYFCPECRRKGIRQV